MPKVPGTGERGDNRVLDCVRLLWEMAALLVYTLFTDVMTHDTALHIEWHANVVAACSVLILYTLSIQVHHYST